MTIVGEKIEHLSDYGRQFCCVCLKTVERYETRTLYWSDGSATRFHACTEHADRL